VSTRADFASDSRPVLLSGIAPSGRLTLGNYLGAIRNWVTCQDRYRSYFPLVDLHAITVRQDPQTFAQRCRDFIALYIACGIDPARSAIFVQSHVPEHSELAWILQCFTQVGELNRMTQFKDKRQQNRSDVNVGLFTYPVLMAADILLYRTSLVPVGDDQRQHLQLTRDLAQRFNHRHGALFTVPEVFVPGTGARIMALQDPLRKMSKSDPADTNVVALLDPLDAITRKIKRAVTDSGSEIVARPDKPGVTNLLDILSASTGVTVASLEDRYRGQGYGRLKQDAADAVVALVEPIQQRFAAIRGDERALADVLAQGAEQARTQARGVLAEVRERLGLIPG
jgi:tryptophanyl-tRNA synthetase